MPFLGSMVVGGLKHDIVKLILHDIVQVYYTYALDMRIYTHNLNTYDTTYVL